MPRRDHSRASLGRTVEAEARLPALTDQVPGSTPRAVALEQRPDGG